MKVSDITADAQVISAGRSGYAPKISIVTPTYCRNAEGLLLRCLDSAAMQTFSDFEHIIIDDGSSDGSQAVLTDAALRDDRIVYVRHDRNSGLPAVRTNEGIMRARGDAVAFLFDDNVLVPDFLEKAWDRLETSDADVIITNVEMLTKHGESFFLGGWPQTMELLRNLNTIPNGGVLVRRSFFERFGLYDPHLLMRRICDWDLWLRALRLGAKFAQLDTVSAVEYGLVSPNSLGNTIAWDVKVVYGYMLDEKNFAERSKTLTPARIADVDVLDPKPFFPYLRNSEEWLETIKTFFEPFTRRANGGSSVALTNRQSVTLPAVWFPKVDGPARRRVLLVSNLANAWVGTWLDELRRDSALIVLNTPEWNLAAFRPKDIDVLMLFGCSFSPINDHVRAFRDAGVPVIYVAGHGLDIDGDTAARKEDPRDFMENSHVASMFNGTVHFGQPRAPMSIEHRHGAMLLAGGATMVLGSRAMYDSLGAVCPRGDLPRLPNPSWEVRDVTASPPSGGIVTFDLPPGLVPGALEQVTAPNDNADASFATNPTMRSSWESIGSLAQARHDVRVVVAATDYDELPVLERFGIAVAAARNRVEITSTDDRVLKVDAVECEAVGAWMRNYVRIASTHRNRLDAQIVALFLNSEMFSGSEVYGLALARNLSLLGTDVRVFVPEENAYGMDSGLAEINNWLKGHGLKEAERAPYMVGNTFLGLDEVKQNEEIDRIGTFISQRSIGTVICSGFMPVFAAVNEERSNHLYMALFQPSAYDMADLSYLRGRVSGILSDCEWSLDYLSRIFEGPSRVVRTSLPLDEGNVTPIRTSALTTDGPLSIAIGGTLQPRKRQLEAVLAVSLLREAGYDVKLNIYGYALSICTDYVQQIDDQIERLHLTDCVRRFGLAPMGEIAANNDIILSASLDESMPQTLLELLRCGLVGVGVLSGGIDEILRDNETGYLAHDASEHGIAAVLRRAIDDRANWPARIRQAQAILARDYSRQSSTNALVSLLFEGSGNAHTVRSKGALSRSKAA